MLQAFARLRALREAEVALETAATFAEWHAAADAHDRLSGAADWRDDDAAPWYDADLLRADVRELAALRAAGDGAGLAAALSASVYRHQADLGAPELYAVALAGTKRLVTRWHDEVEASLRWLAVNPVAGLGEADKRARFAQAWQVYGRSALLLSGGATWGFHHLGVVKALFEAGALPHILSGASTGAMVAAGICTRNDGEIAALFADLSAIRLDGLAPVGLRRAWREGGWLDPDRLLAVIRHNAGDATFAEAYAHSGRVLTISVSPTRSRQKPRVLSHLTSPDVLVARAALASSALPGLFPPVVLEERVAGVVRPYAPHERWADGSIYGDLPKLRLARLHNVNHFVVSQTNPHVAPILRVSGGRGVVPAVAGVATATARGQGAVAADLARRVPGPGRELAERAYSLVTQDYRGDIDIHPRFRPELLRKMVVNPTPADLATFVREGERATWAKLPAIVDQTRLGRVFRELLKPG